MHEINRLAIVLAKNRKICSVGIQSGKVGLLYQPDTQYIGIQTNENSKCVPTKMSPKLLSRSDCICGVLCSNFFRTSAIDGVKLVTDCLNVRFQMPHRNNGCGLDRQVSAVCDNGPIC